MLSALVRRLLCAVSLVVVSLGTSLASADLKIYIVTDLEGASGVYKFAQTREPGNPLGEQANEYLMGDIAAVVRGLRAAGATDILVLDGHGSQAFVPHLMEPGAVKEGISREAAALYPFAETRKLLFEGAKRAVASIPECKPYRLTLPIKVKKQHLVFESKEAGPRLMTKEGTVEDVLKLLSF